MVERLPELARGASGNPQGVLYAKLSPHFTPLTRLILSGYGYSLRTLRASCRKTMLIGAAAACCNWRMMRRKRNDTTAWPAPASTRCPQAGRRAEASELAGVELPHGGLFFPQGGWVNPPALVRKLVEHPNIRVHQPHHRRTGLQPAGQELGRHRRRRLGGDRLGGHPRRRGGNRRLRRHQHLPLKKIRGQVTVARATTQSEALRTVLCGEGYISPARFGEHCLGATFKFNTGALGVNLFEHQENLHMLAGLAPCLYKALGGEALLEKALSGRASLRCTSPDYLPIVGPVAHAQSLIDTYLPLSRTPRCN